MTADHAVSMYAYATGWLPSEYSPSDIGIVRSISANSASMLAMRVIVYRDSARCRLWELRSSMIGKTAIRASADTGDGYTVA